MLLRAFGTASRLFASIMNPGDDQSIDKAEKRAKMGELQMGMK